MLSFISNPKGSNYRQLLLIHGAITLVASGITLSVLNEKDSSSFLLGQLFVWISLISIGVSITLFFLKKNIALIVGIIVLKWPILMYVVYILTERVKPNMVWLSLGTVPILVSALIWSVLQKD